MPSPTELLIVPLLNRSGLRDAQVQRHMRDLAGKGAIRVERGEDAVGLGGKHDIGKAALFEMLDELKRGGDELLGLRQVIALGDGAVERAGVHADANGGSRLPPPHRSRRRRDPNRRCCRG